MRQVGKIMFGNSNVSSSDLLDAIKTDQKSIVNGVIAAIVAYLGAGSLITGKTNAQLHDMIDDILTAKIAMPLGEMFTNAGATGAIGGLLSIGATAYLEVGDRIANYFVPLSHDEVTGALDVTSAPTEGTLSAVKMLFGGLAFTLTVVDFKKLTAALTGGN